MEIFKKIFLFSLIILRIIKYIKTDNYDEKTKNNNNSSSSEIQEDGNISYTNNDLNDTNQINESYISIKIKYYWYNQNIKFINPIKFTNPKNNENIIIKKEIKILNNREKLIKLTFPNNISISCDGMFKDIKQVISNGNF